MVASQLTCLEELRAAKVDPAPTASALTPHEEKRGVLTQ